jgi:hypothetical protein
MSQTGNQVDWRVIFLLLLLRASGQRPRTGSRDSDSWPFAQITFKKSQVKSLCDKQLHCALTLVFQAPLRVGVNRIAPLLQHCELMGSQQIS